MVYLGRHTTGFIVSGPSLKVAGTKLVTPYVGRGNRLIHQDSSCVVCFIHYRKILNVLSENVNVFKYVDGVDNHLSIIHLIFK